MIQLSNRELTLDLLDPDSDPSRLGTRYCWGGYIWQVHDVRHGPLLTGPEWPEPKPTPFNGQGLPESFRFRTRDERALTWNGREGVHLGGGSLRASATGEAEMAEPCRWTLTRQPDRLTYRTSQQAFGYDYELMRRIELTDRTVTSTSLLTNHGTEPLHLEWFPHPFFALTDGLVRAEMSPGFSMAENPGFHWKDNVITLKRRFTGPRDGHMELMTPPTTGVLRAQIDHPRLEGVEFETSYTPSECPIWANGLTFSIEPYLAAVLPPGQSHRWNVRYRFGQGR
jgi:hypothetical protein